MSWVLLLACTNIPQEYSANRDVLTYSNTIEILDSDTRADIVAKAAHVVPTDNQYSALKNEFIAFVHFGPNTFTRMEWGTGMEDPQVFDLQHLDTDQWCEAMQAAGMKMVIITAKHHDGFVLWQSRYTQHGIMSSPFKEGKGDILKELSASCQKYGIKLGIYLSPADLYQIEQPEGLYGNLSPYTDRKIPRQVSGRPFKNTKTFTFRVDDYNEYFLNQLFELLTEYGSISEVWFDGAHPKRKGGQKYNYLAWKRLIKALAPEAVVFGKQDIRWCGNESGRTRETEWNVIAYAANPDTMNYFQDLTADSLGHRKQLYQARYLHYQPAETNTSIREGWFYRDEVDQKVRNADDVFDMYERSVGGNSIFLLNIPPNRQGVFSDEDVAVLGEVGRRISATYDNNLLSKLDDGALELQDNQVIVSLMKPSKVNRFVIQEDISRRGERIEEHALDAWIDDQWKEIANATNVGYKRILRFEPVYTDQFRLRIIKSRLEPSILHLSAHYYPVRPPLLSIRRSSSGKVVIEPSQHIFGWKPHGENAADNLNRGYEVRYTLDGSTPDDNSSIYAKPFLFSGGMVRALAFYDGQKGGISKEELGMIKSGWTIMDAIGAEQDHPRSNALDEDPATYWLGHITGLSALTIDFGQVMDVRGMAYTPFNHPTVGMVSRGEILVSRDRKQWEVVDNFRFGNIRNDPSTRKHIFKLPIRSRYVRIQPTEIEGSHDEFSVAEVDFYKTLTFEE